MLGMRHLLATLSAMLTLLLVDATQSAVAAEFEFIGTPTTKVQVTDGTVRTESLTQAEGRELQVRILRDGDNFIWASRNNVPLVKRESGAYITYVAVNGAGYIRVLTPTMRSIRDALPPNQRDKEFVFMEHLVHQLGSITYFGK